MLTQTLGVTSESKSKITCPYILHEMVTNLFLQTVFITNFPIVQVDPIDVPMVSEDELLEATKKVRENLVPGLVSIPKKALRSVVKVAPNMHTRVFTSWLKGEIYSKEWKKRRLILIVKLNKPSFEVSSYRLIFLLVLYWRIILLHNLLQITFDYRKGWWSL